MPDIVNGIRQQGVLPLVTIEKKEDAVPTARALCNGGIRIMEVAFRTDCAAECLNAIVQACPAMTVGAGTLHSREDIDRAMAAGASFLVSAGFDRDVLAYALKQNIMAVPGVCTPGEIETALIFGLHTLKFFPSEVMGGVKMLKALQGPYGDVSFIPSGGINEENMQAYLSLSNVCAVSSSWIASKKDISAHAFDVIEKKARRAVQSVNRK